MSVCKEEKMTRCHTFSKPCFHKQKDGFTFVNTETHSSVLSWSISWHSEIVKRMAHLLFNSNIKFSEMFSYIFSKYIFFFSLLYWPLIIINETNDTLFIK